MFRNRLLSAVVLILITIAALVLGGNLLLGILLCVSLIGCFELFRVFQMEKTILAFIGYTMCVFYYGLLYFEIQDAFAIFCIALILLYLVIYVVKYPEYEISQIAVMFFGVIYAGVLLSYIYRLRLVESGIFLVWLIFIGAWGSDTCAYCTGVLIGKHKLPSELSPKKTIEGCIGGVIGAALIGLIFTIILKSRFSNYTSPQIMIPLICAVTAVISQIGDLAASAIKRNYGIKDYGTLIPGHGGILDRFDSILFVSPIVYYLISITVM